MRSRLTIIMLAGALLAPTGTAAGATPDPVAVEWGPAVPCAFWCAYWSMPHSAGFRPCENPFPAGSYVDVVTDPAPALGEHMMLVVTIEYEVDWDLFVCARLSNGSNNGPMLGKGNQAISGCKGETPGIPGLYPIPYGCDEIAEIPVAPGGRYVLRAYSWSDPSLARGGYRFVGV